MYDEEKPKGNMKAIIIPCVVLALVLFAVGIGFYYWDRAKDNPMTEGVILGEQKTEEDVENLSEANALLKQAIEEMTAENEQKQLELQKQIEELKGTASTDSETTVTQQVTPTAPTTGTTQTAPTQSTETVSTKRQIIETSKEKLGVTSNSNKAVFTVKEKKMYIVDGGAVNAPSNSTSYVLVLESENGIVIPMYTTYSAYSSTNVGSKFKVEYLIYGEGANTIYDIYKVEK